MSTITPTFAVGDTVRATETRYNSLGFWIRQGETYEVVYSAPEREIIGLRDQGLVEWWTGRFRRSNPTSPPTCGTAGEKT